MNENLANQLVVVTKADYEAMVHEQAHKEAVALSEPKSSDITSKGEVIKSIMCNGERFLSRKDAAKILDVGLPTLWRWNNEGLLHAIQFKDPIITLVLSLLTGQLGIDRFFIGDTGLGIGKLITCGGLGIWTIIDWFLIMNATREKNFERLLTIL